jgi:hypothetical protein
MYEQIMKIKLHHTTLNYTAPQVLQTLHYIVIHYNALHNVALQYTHGHSKDFGKQGAKKCANLWSRPL